jgi:orotidine-5'-phosphate decarboxylase
MKPGERIILALDVAEYEEAIRLVRTFRDHVEIFKVGSELFTAVGPRIIKEINFMGKKVFLDLKWHDIPNTVGKSVRAAAQLGVFICNVHTSGGFAMMKEAAETLSRFCLEHDIERPRLIGVTVLTSIDNNALRDELSVTVRMDTQVKHLASLAQRAGLDGVVASAEEAGMIRSRFGPGFIIITPGIRPSWAARDDQKRALSPREALRRGADYLVIGRAVTSQDDPLGSLNRIVEELSGL